MKHFDEEPLLNDLLSSSELEAFRESSLQSGLAALRRAKRRGRVVRCGVVAAFAIVAIVLLLAPDRPPAESAVDVAGVDPPQAPPTVESSSVQIIDDAELFALFPDRPLALVGPPGNQQLIFLDEVSATAH